MRLLIANQIEEFVMLYVEDVEWYYEIKAPMGHSWMWNIYYGSAAGYHWYPFNSLCTRVNVGWSVDPVCYFYFYFFREDETDVVFPKDECKPLSTLSPPAVPE